MASIKARELRIFSTDAERRTAWLAGKGWRVIRFWNNEILTNIEGVTDTILRELGRSGD